MWRSLVVDRLCALFRCGRWWGDTLETDADRQIRARRRRLEALRQAPEQQQVNGDGCQQGEG
ncbi:MAG: hypothetical protein Tsb0017_16830 [Geothermobacteraceae bacterium]